MLSLRAYGYVCLCGPTALDFKQPVDENKERVRSCHLPLPPPSPTSISHLNSPSHIPLTLPYYLTLPPLSPTHHSTLPLPPLSPTVQVQQLIDHYKQLAVVDRVERDKRRKAKRHIKPYSSLLVTGHGETASVVWLLLGILCVLLYVPGCACYMVSICCLVCSEPYSGNFSWEKFSWS